MKTFLLSVLCLWLALAQSQAQAPNFNNVRPVEFEVGLGLIQAHRYYDTNAALALQGLMELRLNHTPTPFDVGLQFALAASNRERVNPPVGYYYRYKTLTTFVDYNFRRWKNISLFAGLGLGMSFVDLNSDYEGYADDDYYLSRSFVMNPRVGVEFFNRIRLTAEFKAMDYEYSYFGLNLGVVIGGGRRR